MGFLGTGSEKNVKMRFVPIGEIGTALFETQGNCWSQKHLIGIGLNVRNQLEKDPTIINQICSIQPRNIWISGVPYENYVKIVKAADPPVKIFVQVSNVDDAINASLLGADVIIVRGEEAGGSPWITSSLYKKPLLEVIPQTLYELTKFSIKNPKVKVPLLVAAGGIQNGQQIAECLEAGADAVCIGSLFATSKESDLLQDEKLALLSKLESNTVSVTNHNDSKLNINAHTLEVQPVDEIMKRLNAELLSHVARYETVTNCNPSVYIVCTTDMDD